MKKGCTQESKERSEEKGCNEGSLEERKASVWKKGIRIQESLAFP